jgi:hypothetical protein
LRQGWIFYARRRKTRKVFEGLWRMEALLEYFGVWEIPKPSFLY